MDKRPSLRSWAIAIAALWVPATYLVTVLVTDYLKQTNPDNVDITAGLAYLRQGLTTTVVTALIIIAIDVWLIVMMYRKERSFVSAKLPLALLIAGVVLMGLVMVANSYQDSLEDQYRQTHSLRAS